MKRASAPRHAALIGLPTAFTYSQARAAGMSKRSLYLLRDAQLIEPLARGLYHRTDDGPTDLDLLAIAARSPRATLCLRSALARHGLTDEIPAAIDIALPRGTRPPAIDTIAAWHHFDPAMFDLGRDTLKLTKDLTIGLYGAERSIIDAFRLRRTEGHELGNEALRRWLRRRGAHPSDLLQLAAKFPRAETPLRAALEVLL